MNSLDSVQSIFRDIFDDPDLEIDASTSPGDIAEWDSVAHLKIVLALEDAFDGQFSASDLTEFCNVGDFLRALENTNSTVPVR